jgi:hypothetical protein
LPEKTALVRVTSRLLQKLLVRNPEKIIGKLDKINTKLEDKGKAGINLKSGTANMLVKKAQKSPPKYRGFGADSKDISLW